MTVDEALAALREAGSEQIRSIYARHGVAEPQLGVRHGDLDQLRKRIKTDDALAAGLWATGIHDARVLACKISDPRAIPAETLDAWAADTNSHVLADALGGLAAKSPHRARLAETWRADPRELVARLGWRMVAHRAMGELDLPTPVLVAWLGEIERELPTAPNRTRGAMLDALIAIGGTHEAARARALAVADALGPIEIDHGETACKTPDPVAYIQKMAARTARTP